MTDPILLDAARDMFKARNSTGAGSAAWRRLVAEHPYTGAPLDPGCAELADLARAHTGKRAKVEYTPTTSPRIDYGPKQPFRSVKVVHSVFDAGMGLPPGEMQKLFPSCYPDRKPENTDTPAGKPMRNERPRNKWATAPEVKLGSEEWSDGTPAASLAAPPARPDFDPDDRHRRRRERRPLYAGTSALGNPDGELPPIGTWHVDSVAEWSEKRLYCVIDGVELTGDRTKYCSDRCSAEGNNARRRAKTAKRNGRRKWSVDSRGWYMQSPPPPPACRIGVHRYDEHEASVLSTVSRDYRLRWPWAGEQKVWKITLRSAA